MIQLISILLFNLANLLLLHTKSEKTFAGFIGVIALVIFFFLGYALTVGYQENKKKQNSDNGSVGCLIIGCIVGILGALFMIKQCVS